MADTKHCTNVMSLLLFVYMQMRKTVGVSVFPVGFSGGLKLEGPLCLNGTASKWHAAWDPDRSEFIFQFQHYVLVL